LDQQIKRLEQWMQEVFRRAPEIDLLLTLLGVGCILSVVIASEVGDVRRFEGPDHLA
jgi:transposase